MAGRFLTKIVSDARLQCVLNQSFALAVCHQKCVVPWELRYACHSSVEVAPDICLGGLYFAVCLIA